MHETINLKYLYLIKNNNYNRRISIPLAVFETAIPTGE
jgi:hypothetical protein